MIGREDKNHVMHWFPRAGHLTDPLEPLGMQHTETTVEDDHSGLYIGDFPPKDQYKKDIQ